MRYVEVMLGEAENFFVCKKKYNTSSKKYHMLDFVDGELIIVSYILG